MIRILFALLLLMSIKSYAAEMYNAIATAYVTTTISQNVVFDSTMQQGGTFTFSVLAHNGGGRAGQSDTANVKIQFYTSSGTLVSSVNSSYSANLTQPTASGSGGLSGNPQADPNVPWSTLTVSSVNCGGSCANVAYAKISMYGIDGSYWAGDYGPWYRAPTFTLNGGSNMAYNPEFGPYNSVNAQGWTTSPAMGACQGAWGGSNPCIVNSSGTPGTSTVGLVANQNGGGPDANGGTTSGTAGGYNSTMTTSSPAGVPAPVPTKIYNDGVVANATVKIINVIPTSYNSPSGEGSANAFDNNPYTKYLNFDKYNAGVTAKLNSGRVVTGFTITTANDFPGRDPTSYKLYGSNDGVNWTLIQQGNLSLSDNRYTESSLISVTNSNAYVYYYIFFPGTKAGDGCGQDCNSMQISEITFYYDANSTVTSTDAGSGSVVDPVQAGPTVVSTSNSNSVTTSSTNTNSSNVNADVTTNSGGTISTTTNTYSGTTTVTTTTTTPVTTTTWSDGSTTTSNGTPTTTTSTTYTINTTLGIAPIYSSASPNTSGNSVYIKQTSAGTTPTVSITQDGNNNAVTGVQSGWAIVDGNGTSLTTKQYGQGNIIGINMNAWGNDIKINQGTTSADANNNILMFDSHGNGNSATINQLTNSNSASVKLTYDINTVNLTQRTGTGNTSLININGNWNTVNNTQTGSNNFAIVNITGDNNTATVNQTGTGHSTLLNLINAGGANTVSVTQTGNADTYSLQQTCANAAGCSVSVTRSK